MLTATAAGRGVHRDPHDASPEQAQELELMLIWLTMSDK